MISFMCLSGLLLDAFAQRWEDAVSGAPAVCSSHLASRIPVSRQQEGAVLFPQTITNRRAAPSPLYSPFQIPLVIKINAKDKSKALVYDEDLSHS